MITIGKFSKRPEGRPGLAPLPAPVDLTHYASWLPDDLFTEWDRQRGLLPVGHLARKLAGRLVVEGHLRPGPAGFAPCDWAVREWLLDVLPHILPVTAAIAEDDYERAAAGVTPTMDVQLRARARRYFAPVALAAACRRSMELTLLDTGESVVGVARTQIWARSLAEIFHPWQPQHPEDEPTAGPIRPGGAEDLDGANELVAHRVRVGGCGDTLWCPACAAEHVREQRRRASAGILAARVRYQAFTQSEYSVSFDENDRYLAPHVRDGSFEKLTRSPGSPRWYEQHWVLTAPHSGFAPLDAERIHIAFELLMQRFRQLLRAEYGLDATVVPVPYLRAWECTPGDDMRGHVHLHLWVMAPELDRELLRHLWGQALTDAATRMTERAAGIFDLSSALPAIETRPLEAVLQQVSSQRRRERLQALLVERRKHSRPPLQAVYQGGVRCKRAGDGVESEVIKSRYLPVVWKGELVDPRLFADVYLALLGRDRVRGSHGLNKKPDPRTDWLGEDGNVGAARPGRRV